MLYNIVDFICNNTNRMQKIIDVGKGDEERSFSKQDLILQVRAFSGYLLEREIQTSDNLVLIPNNSFETVVVFLAIVNVGAIVSVVPIKNSFEDIEKTIDNIQPKLIIASNDYSCLDSLIQTYEKEVFLYDKGTFLENNVNLNDIDKHFGDDDTPISILFSSGTTSKPKGVILPYRAYVNNVIQIGEHIKLSSEDYYLATLPFSFIAGQITSVFTPLHYGSNVVICNSQNIRNILSVMERYRITKTNLVPTLLYRILNSVQPTDYDTSNLKFILSGGSACNPQLIYEMSEKFNIKIIEGYGSTEMGCGICINDIENPLVGSVGKPLPGHEVTIIPEEKTDKNQGIIKIKSNTMMLGYYNGTLLSKNNWYTTSDIGYLDEKHSLHLLGRKDDVIKCCGEKVYLLDIQDIIVSDKNVENAVVVGIEDEERNKIPVAFVKLVNKQYQDEFQSKIQAAFSRVSKPKIIYVDEFPTTYSEKINIQALKIFYFKKKLEKEL